VGDRLQTGESSHYTVFHKKTGRGPPETSSSFNIEKTLVQAIYTYN